MADIFVSYSRTDKARVAPLVKALEAQGWSVWWDPEITPGDEFDSLISRELEAARAVVVVWTPDSVESRWVRGEARDAADRGVLVPVRFENAKLPIDLRAMHTTELDGWGENRQGAAIRGAVHGTRKRSWARRRNRRRRRRTASDRQLDLRAALRQHERRPGAGIFLATASPRTSSPTSARSRRCRSCRATGVLVQGRDTRRGRNRTPDQGGLCARRQRAQVRARVRITAQLVAAANDAQVWGERYDRDLNDIFALQDEISKAIVTALKLTLLPEKSRPLNSAAPPIRKPTSCT